MIYQVWALLFLLICAIEDLVKQKIHIWICITNALTAIIVKLVSGNMKWKEYAIALGVCVLIYAFILVTKEDTLTENGQKLMDFVLSTEGQQIVEENKLITID